MTIPTHIDDFEDWLYDDVHLNIDATDDALLLAKRIAFEGIKLRAKEYGLPAPRDMSGKCKHASLFFKAVFGGEIKGNIDHQFNFLNGKVLDLNSDAADVQEMLSSGTDIYKHDSSFFGNPEHLESLLTCIPRVQAWAIDFERIWECAHTNDLQEFASSRIGYLNGLTNISPGWLSDGKQSFGEVPNQQVVNVAKDVFLKIISLEKQGYEWDFNKFLLAPTIAGGISIEVKDKDDEIFFVVTLSNSSSCEIEVRKNEVWENINFDLAHSIKNFESIFPIKSNKKLQNR